jgi:hypothetical protein
MPDCPSIDPLLTPYVDGELPGVEREAVAQHLHACPVSRAWPSSRPFAIWCARGNRPVADQRLRPLCARRARCSERWSFEKFAVPRFKNHWNL